MHIGAHCHRRTHLDVFTSLSVHDLWITQGSMVLVHSLLGMQGMPNKGRESVLPAYLGAHPVMVADSWHVPIWARMTNLAPCRYFLGWNFFIIHLNLATYNNIYNFPFRKYLHIIGNK